MSAHPSKDRPPPSRDRAAGEPLRVLLVEDSPTAAKLVAHALRSISRPLELERVETAAAMREALERRRWDIVISDWAMPQFSGGDALDLLNEMQPDTPFILVSGTVGDEIAVTMMRAGAKDYVLKEKLTRLAPAVERELREHASRRERQVAEAARREAELRFGRLFDSGIIGITVASISGAITEANDTFLAMVGYTREDLEAGALRWREMTPVEWRAAHIAAGKDLRVRGSSRPFEKEYLRKDGTRVPVLVGLALLDDSRVLTVVTDLTERKRLEERKSAVVHAALDAVIVMDHTGAIVEFNPAAEQTFGYRRAEVLGRNLADQILPERLRAGHRERVARLLAADDASSNGQRLELSMVGRDGVEIPVELSVSRIGSGKAVSFVAFLRDISERKRVEVALLERMRVAALGAEVGMALSAAPTVREMLGKCCEAIVTNLGASFARIWTLNEATQVLDLQASAGLYTHIDGPHGHVPVGKFKIGLIAQERRPHLTNDVQGDPRVGDPDWARREGMRAFAGHPLLVGGEVVGVIAMFAREPLTDVATAGLAAIADAIAMQIRGRAVEEARLSLETQLRQAQKMEAVGRLAGGIAHDFNNVLSVILSYGDLLLDDLKPGDPIRDDVAEIQKAGLRAADLTRQLLTFSRQQVIEPKVLDLNEVLSGMQKMLERLVGEDVELTAIAGASVGCVHADPGSLDQVIMNLAVNARDAMPTGGKLTMEIANVVLDEEYARSHLGAKPGSYVMLSVTDTGIGIDKATQARIFEPFFTTKGQGKGTGLGLSTVFGIVQQSGGSVWVTSELGRGTTFSVYLPRVDAVADESRPTRVPTSLRGSETILLVEDEDQVRDVANGILRRHGYAVVEARNAGEALLICEEHIGAIHLLLSDVVMPGMSGPVLARRLLNARPEMKVLCMSGYTDDAALRHGVMDAGFAFLQKPLTVEALTRKVRDVLDSTKV